MLSTKYNCGVWILLITDIFPINKLIVAEKSSKAMEKTSKELLSKHATRYFFSLSHFRQLHKAWSRNEKVHWKLKVKKDH